MSSPEISIATSLDSDAVDAIDALVQRATGTDGVAPLNEQSLLLLHDDAGRRVRHVRAESDGALVGYAIAEGADTLTVECVVDPAHRRRGIGRELIEAAIDTADAREARAWAHGDLPGSPQLAATTGFERVRLLLKMRAVLDDRLNEPDAADGITFRTFRPGADDAAWLAINARAFVDHPEQGSMTQHDLDQRIASDWFDADGFFLAERDGDIVGFHWTKVTSEGDEPIGEVYVVGVDPAAQGLGLGSALTQLGLVHLQRRGIRTVDLYVEGDNGPALTVYRRLGFSDAARDVMYARQIAL